MLINCCRIEEQRSIRINLVTCQIVRPPLHLIKSKYILTAYCRNQPSVTMSQYSSFLATAPALKVLQPTSSPESIRQFGNPSQLAKPWFIFRRPSAMRYTPRKESQQLETPHDDSTTSVMSSANPESVLHEDTDCFATTAAEEITAAKVPEIILYEQIGTRSSTDVTICEPSINLELISKAPESPNAEIIAAEVPGTIPHEQTDTHSSTDIAIFEPYNNQESIKAPTSSNADINYVIATATEEITAAEVPETILYEQINNRSSTDVTIFKPSTDPELTFETSESSNADIDRVVTTAAEGITDAEVPETDIRSSTNPELIFKVSKSSNANINYIVTTAAEQITAAEVQEPILYEQIEIRSATNVTIFEPSTSPELIDSVSKCSSQHVNPTSGIFSAVTTHLKLSDSMPAVSHGGSDSVATTTDEVTTVKVTTSPEIKPYEHMDPDHVSYDVPPVTTNSLTSAETSEKLFDDNPSMQITALTPATKLEPMQTVPALTRQKTERHSNAPFSELTPVARSSIFSNQGIDFGSDTTVTEEQCSSPLELAELGAAAEMGPASPKFLKGKDKPTRSDRSNRLLELRKSKVVDPTTQSSGRPVKLAAIAANTSRPRSRSLLPTAPQVPQQPVTRPSPPRRSTQPKKFGSSRFAGSVLHLPTADEDEARRRHALASGKLTRAPKVGMSVHPSGTGMKKLASRQEKVQERVGSNATLAVMVEEEEGEEVAECNPIPAAEKVEEKAAKQLVEEETGAVISGPLHIAPRGVGISGAWPFSRSQNVRRKPIVWRKLDNIPEAECEEDEPPVLEVSLAQAEPVVAPKDLEEAPITNSEEGGGVSVETPTPEEKVEEVVEEDSGAGINPVEAAPPCPIPYPVPSRWSSRIGEMRTPRKPSYGWQTESQTSAEAGSPEPMSARRVERVRYPAPMRWSSRIGEVKGVRTLGYASPSRPAAPEPSGGEVDTDPGSEVFPLFFGLMEEAVIVPQEEEEQSSNSGESRESQGEGVKKTGSLRRRAKQAWKKIGRVFSGGRR